MQQVGVRIVSAEDQAAHSERKIDEGQRNRAFLKRAVEGLMAFWCALTCSSVQLASCMLMILGVQSCGRPRWPWETARHKKGPRSL